MRPSILYLDDDPGSLGVFYEVLHWDYDVRTASSAAEAHRMLAERAAEIVISDQMMPDIEGTEFLRQVAASYPQTCRIMITGGAAVGNMLPEIGAGVIHLFVTKPWTEWEMRQTLSRAVLLVDSRPDGK